MQIKDTFNCVDRHAQVTLIKNKTLRIKNVKSVLYKQPVYNEKISPTLRYLSSMEHY